MDALELQAHDHGELMTDGIHLDDDARMHGTLDGRSMEGWNGQERQAKARKQADLQTLEAPSRNKMGLFGLHAMRL